MPYRPRRGGRYQRKSQPHANQTLQKPNGVIGPRVRKVGGEHRFEFFARGFPAETGFPALITSCRIVGAGACAP